MADQKTILVTGATGRPGRAVTATLVAQGYLRAMTRRPDGDKAHSAHNPTDVGRPRTRRGGIIPRL